MRTNKLLCCVMVLCFLIPQDTYSQPSQDEIRLYLLIMEYRAQYELPQIPFSVSLTQVAQTHAKDVYYHFDEIPAGCNSHSWSSHGPWQRCDYYPDHRNSKLMWSKPRELTNYEGNGYEICHFYNPPSSGICTPQRALDGWKSSSGHNAVILNIGKWCSKEWKAIGMGMFKGVACVWFGAEDDPAGFYVIK